MSFYLNTFTTKATTLYTGTFVIGHYEEGDSVSTFTPTFNSTNTWIRHLVSLPPTASDTAEVRFYGTAGGELEDKGVDDFHIYPFPCGNIGDDGIPFDAVSQWTDYSPCSGSCGTGHKTRTRTCLYPPCTEEVYEGVLDCNEGCRLDTCPVEEGGDCDCNWDEGEPCGVLKPSAEDHWQVGTSTPTEGTGPDNDHTLFPVVECEGNFIYMDASDMEEGETAYLATDNKLKSTSICISFYLSMVSDEPSQMGSFSVYLWQKNLKTIIFEHHGVLDEMWNKINITVTPAMIRDSAQPFMIVFEGVRGSGELSDIALDDVKIRDGECSERVNGFWSAWTEWIECPFTCESGEQTRGRACDSPAPSNEGADCEGDDEQSRPCSDLLPCPVQGGWNEYSEWSLCDVTCGDGNRYMYRECIDPKPIGDMTSYCLDTESRPALTEELTETCQGEDGVCNIDGMWGQWTFMDDCDQSCLGGLGTEARSCDDPEQSGSGSVCEGGNGVFESQPVTCNTHLCPIDGDWSDWTQWTDCEISCGENSQARERSCNDPEPENGGLSCGEDPEEVRSCDIPLMCPIDGNWNNWIQTECSETCGVGEYHTIRSCNDPEPEFEGAFCDGDSFVPYTCQADVAVCPVDGGWSAYSPDACPTGCGYSLQLRQRTCTDPPQAGTGADCDGSDESEIDCFGGFCPDINECAFSAFTTCNFDMTAFSPNRWSVTAGPIDNGGDGPANDATGDGNYLYFETSTSGGGASFTGDEHYFSIPLVAQSQLMCLEFYLYFHDELTVRPPGSFRVDRYDDGGALVSNLYEITASAADEWIQIRLDVPVYDSVHEIRFSATRGNPRGDRAIDGIRFIHNTPCDKVDSLGSHTFSQ